MPLSMSLSYPDPLPAVTLLKDTLQISGASGFVIGISGGVDSALAAALCCRAAGPSSVTGLFLPSDVTPTQDASDVRILGDTLGIRIMTVPIGPVLDQYHSLPGFTDTPYLVGNLMARTRMTILYYYANKLSGIVCGTSNYTEYLLGYCTKYGDNAADVQPIIHLLKTEVWRLAELVGVPEQIISRTPTAGLYQDQTDEKELGLSYARIDAAILALIQQDWMAVTADERKVLEKIRTAEHKRSPTPQVKR